MEIKIIFAFALLVIVPALGFSFVAKKRWCKKKKRQKNDVPIDEIVIRKPAKPANHEPQTVVLGQGDINDDFMASWEAALQQQTNGAAAPVEEPKWPARCAPEPQAPSRDASRRESLNRSADVRVGKQHKTIAELQAIARQEQRGRMSHLGMGELAIRSKDTPEHAIFGQFDEDEYSEELEEDDDDDDREWRSMPKRTPIAARAAPASEKISHLDLTRVSSSSPRPSSKSPRPPSSNAGASAKPKSKRSSLAPPEEMFRPQDSASSGPGSTKRRPSKSSPRAQWEAQSIRAQQEEVPAGPRSTKRAPSTSPRAPAPSARAASASPRFSDELEPGPTGRKPRRKKKSSEEMAQRLEIPDVGFSGRRPSSTPPGARRTSARRSVADESVSRNEDWPATMF